MGRYDYDDFGFGGYEGQRRDMEVVSFYRPDGECEGKDIGWCLDNGFFEIEDGLWSGDWYYEHHPNYKSEQEAAGKEICSQANAYFTRRLKEESQGGEKSGAFRRNLQWRLSPQESCV